MFNSLLLFYTYLSNIGNTFRLFTARNSRIYILDTKFVVDFLFLFCILYQCQYTNGVGI